AIQRPLHLAVRTQAQSEDRTQTPTRPDNVAILCCRRTDTSGGHQGQDYERLERAFHEVVPSMILSSCCTFIPPRSSCDVPIVWRIHPFSPMVRVSFLYQSVELFALGTCVPFRQATINSNPYEASCSAPRPV